MPWAFAAGQYFATKISACDFPFMFTPITPVWGFPSLYCGPHHTAQQWDESTGTTPAASRLGDQASPAVSSQAPAWARVCGLSKPTFRFRSVRIPQTQTPSHPGLAKTFDLAPRSPATRHISYYQGVRARRPFG